MPARLRVAHVNDIASVGSTLVAGLRQLGVDATLMTPARPGSGLGRPWRQLAGPLRLAALLSVVPTLRLSGYDIAHVHFAWKAFVGVLAGLPLVVHCHGSDVRDLRSGSVRHAVTGWLLGRAALVYYATPDLAAAVLPLRADARFLPNPIDTTTFAPLGVVPSFDLLIGVRLDPRKGIDEIERIVTALRAARPATTITIVAQGLGVDRIRRVAGPDSRVIRPVPHDQMRSILAEHRIAIGQFRVGAIGNYELEAMASGVPVAAAFRHDAAYDEAPPLIGGDGPDGIARAIAGLLDDDAARAELASAGCRWVVAHHDRGLIAARVLADYRSLLGVDQHLDPDEYHSCAHERGGLLQYDGYDDHHFRHFQWFD